MTGDADFRDVLQRRISGYESTRAMLQARARDIAAELDDTARRLEHARALYEAEFGEAPVAQAAPSPQGSLLPPAPVGSLTNLPWTVAIERVLTDAGGPLHAREIWSRLVDGGFRTEARDPVRSIAAIAVREPQLVKVRPNTFALVRQRLPGTDQFSQSKPESEESDHDAFVRQYVKK